MPPYVPLPALIKRKRACVDLPVKAASMVPFTRLMIIINPAINYIEGVPIL